MSVVCKSAVLRCKFRQGLARVAHDAVCTCVCCASAALLWATAGGRQLLGALLLPFLLCLCRACLPAVLLAAAAASSCGLQNVSPSIPPPQAFWFFKGGVSVWDRVSQGRGRVEANMRPDRAHTHRLAWDRDRNVSLCLTSSPCRCVINTHACLVVCVPGAAAPVPTFPPPGAAGPA